VLRARISARAAKNEDASDATLPVLELQQTACEPLTADELALTIPVDTQGDSMSAAGSLQAALTAMTDSTHAYA
jgi:predicted kinase